MRFLSISFEFYIFTYNIYEQIIMNYIIYLKMWLYHRYNAEYYTFTFVKGEKKLLTNVK